MNSELYGKTYTVPQDVLEYLDKCFDEYNKLFQLSTLQHIKDSLTPLEKEYQENESPDSSTVHNETNL